MTRAIEALDHRAGSRDNECMLDGYVLRNQVYFPVEGVADKDGYRAQWEKEAAEDAVYSAIGIVSHGREDYETLTATRQRLWREFPKKHFGTIVEVGCGYGRVPLLLSRERGVTCDRYFGVDISSNMLARFARYRDEHRVFPGAEMHLVCSSAERLPMADDSVDLVISSAVFLHMGKQYVRSTLERIGRVLKPGGHVVFDTSFPNAHSVGLLPSRLFGLFAPDKPNRSKYYSRVELDSLMRETGVAGKCGSYTIEATEFAILPSRIRKIRIPLASSINRLLSPPPRALEDVVAMMYSVHSPVR
jgi:arsenite methyltransferase